MIVGDINEIKIIGVYDRGIPNQERIVLYAEETVNLGQYGLMIGIRAQGNTAFPIRDNLFWFGDAIITKGDWIFVYTGPGTPTGTNLPNTQQHAYTIHWGRSTTILASNEVVPILFRVDAVHIPLGPAMLPNPSK